MTKLGNKIPFSVEDWNRYKDSAVVVDGEGNEVKDIAIFSGAYNTMFPVFGIVLGTVSSWTKDGKYFSSFDGPSDIFIKPKEIQSSQENTLPFKVGDKVRVVARRPTHGWGTVSQGDIGEVVDIKYLHPTNSNTFIVKFPTQDYWLAKECDIELAEGRVRHIIHYRKILEDGVSLCNLNGITVVGVERGSGMAIHISVCSGDNFSKKKGVEIALNRKNVGFIEGKSKYDLYQWVCNNSETCATVIHKYHLWYDNLRSEMIDKFL